MASVKLRAIRAKHGDSLLLFAGGATVLVDGGPSGVYRRFLKDQLLALKGNGGEAPVIDLMMVSHIDADHIDGILDLTDEMLEARDEERTPIVQIRRAWHNSFADAIASPEAHTTASEVRSEAASLASLFDEINLPKGVNLHDSRMVLASVAQGRQLRLDLKALNVDVNQNFDDRLAIFENRKGSWKKRGLSIDLVGPTQAEVTKLRKKWKKELRKILKKKTDLASAAKSLDTSISNLASLVCIAEADGKRILLTGDARGDMIMEWLEKSGELKPGGEVMFDVVKMPHHGSDRNVSNRFFRRVKAKSYVFCGDGKHGNPEPATLQMLFGERPELDYSVYMTYGPEELAAHKDYKASGNGPRLDELLATGDRARVLKFPAANETYIDIIV